MRRTARIVNLGFDPPTLQEKDKLEVAIGEYNHKLDEKIREIKMTCGLD